MNWNTVKSKQKNFTNIVDHSKRSSLRGSWQIAKDFPSSLRYAFQGIFYSLKTQRNFRIHFVVGFFTLLIGLWLKITFTQLAILVLTISGVIVLELINTAIEAVVDLTIGRRYHPLAGIAKDSSAGAVLIAALCSLFVACFILLPPFLLRIGF